MKTQTISHAVVGCVTPRGEWARPRRSARWGQRAYNSSQAGLVRRSSFGEGGFTLIELMVSMVILLFIVAMLAAAFNAASRAWRGSERDIERFQQARAALDVIARDLTQSLVSSNVPFYANNNSLAFVATVNDDTNAVDMAEVIYRLNWDDPSIPASQRNRAPFKLNRRFTRSTTNNTSTATIVPNWQWDFYSDLTNWPATADYTNIVCDNVVSFSVRCYYTNGAETASFWNSTPDGSVWFEPASGTTLVPTAGDGMMTNMPPSYIDVHLGVVDTKSAALLSSLTNSPAAWANVLRQARRDFNVYVKIPQR